VGSPMEVDRQLNPRLSGQVPEARRGQSPQ
jgi:hypothetical protein